MLLFEECGPENVILSEAKDLLFEAALHHKRNGGAFRTDRTIPEPLHT